MGVKLESMVSFPCTEPFIFVNLALPASLFSYTSNGGCLPVHCCAANTEERLRHQYSQLTQKYIDQLISAEVIGIEGIIDIIRRLENTLGTLITPLIDQALGLVKKATQVIARPRKKKERFLFAFDALSASLDRIDTSVTPTGKHQIGIRHSLYGSTWDHQVPG